MEIKITSVINTTKALSQADGLILYHLVLDNIQNGNSYVISFEGIERISTAFLNASIGKLIVEGKLGIPNLDIKSTKELIKKKLDNVMTNAKNHITYNSSIDDAASIC